MIPKCYVFCSENIFTLHSFHIYYEYSLILINKKKLESCECMNTETNVFEIYLMFFASNSSISVSQSSEFCAIAFRCCFVFGSIFLPPPEDENA